MALDSYGASPSLAFLQGIRLGNKVHAKVSVAVPSLHKWLAAQLGHLVDQWLRHDFRQGLDCLISWIRHLGVYDPSGWVCKAVSKDSHGQSARHIISYTLGSGHRMPMLCP